MYKYSVKKSGVKFILIREWGQLDEPILVNWGVLISHWIARGLRFGLCVHQVSTQV